MPNYLIDINLPYYFSLWNNEVYVHQVTEYWLVEPAEKAVFEYVLNDEEKYIGLKPATRHIISPSFPDMLIDLGRVFG
ncbi:hypothetical protein [Persicitalea jodogahamensis]|uniref:Restriction endonuclease domain-containing protein n=1 Tax=Persicitalea jodogahamensis TaxID=402147 RepID=A0A8J3CZA4_9BACT|nr:hypothetical protein [Persicitalea jodogahamensis]GHB51953.1 hypothetical protein GCM10007390_00680 [Persicitalea jodogahamensis]